jgi:hypothetical protein
MRSSNDVLFKYQFVFNYTRLLGRSEIRARSRIDNVCEIRELAQPEIDRLIEYDFEVVSYHLIHGGDTKEEPLWGILLQHSSQQVFACLMIKPKPDIHWPVIYAFSSFLQSIHLSTINIGDLNTYSKVDIERVNHMDGATIEDVWLGHQFFLNSVCSMEELDKIDGSELVNRVEDIDKKKLDIRIKRKEVFLTEKSQDIYRQHPWLLLRFTLKIAIYLHKKNSNNRISR